MQEYVAAGGIILAGMAGVYTLSNVFSYFGTKSDLENDLVDLDTIRTDLNEAPCTERVLSNILFGFGERYAVRKYEKQQSTSS